MNIYELYTLKLSNYLGLILTKFFFLICV